MQCRCFNSLPFSVEKRNPEWVASQWMVAWLKPACSHIEMQSYDVYYWEGSEMSNVQKAYYCFPEYAVVLPVLGNNNEKKKEDWARLQKVMWLLETGLSIYQVCGYLYLHKFTLIHVLNASIKLFFFILHPFLKKNHSTFSWRNAYKKKITWEISEVFINFSSLEQTPQMGQIQNTLNFHSYRLNYSNKYNTSSHNTNDTLHRIE